MINFLAASGQLDGEKALHMPAEEFLLSFRRRAALLSAVHDDLNRKNRGVEARQLLRRYAAFLAETPQTAALLREESPAEEQALVAGCLRKAAGVILPPLPRMKRLVDALPAGEGDAPASGAPASSQP